MAWQANAQVKNNQSEHLLVQSRMIEGTPVIKIIPGDQGAWFRGMKNGYEISISEFKDGSYSEYSVLEARLKPASEAEFRSPDLPEDYAEPMRKIIYEETFAPASQSFNDMAGANEAMSRMLFGYLLFSSYHPILSEMSGLQIPLPKDISNVFKLKVRINETDIEHEQNMLLRAFYTSLYSPPLNVKPEDRIVTLSWNHSNYNMQFVAYRPERSDDGKNFKPIGGPKIFNANSSSGKLGLITVRDTLPANYENYWYRLAGYDAFGILSEYTESVKVIGRDQTAPPMPEEVQVSEGEKPGEVNITWIADPTPDLLGFQVIASPTEDGEYQRLHEDLLPAKARRFSFTFDTKPVLFYRVLAVDTAYNAAASTMGYLVMYDTIPPKIPVDFMAETDTNYVVTVKWSKSTSDDVKGYRLYKAFHPSHGFVPVTALVINDTTYTDSLADDRLEKKVYYQIVALDHHYNHSKRSEPIFAPIPDKIPPTPPLLMTAVLDKKNQVELTWHKSSSSDVESQTVLRRMAEDSTYEAIAQLSAKDSIYMDTGTGRGDAEYAEYYVLATDSSSNKSKRSNGKRILYKDDLDMSTISLESADPENGNIQLVWDYPAKEYSVLIYRAAKDESFELIGRAQEGTTYTDSSVRKGKEYQYKVTAVETNGYRSPISEVLSVKVE